jgi:hypothetical protein
MDAEYLCSHSKWKHREEDKGGIFRKCSDSLNAKLKESNGILNIVDSKRLHAETFEDFIGTLERQSVLAGRKVDLFILDNVDGLDRFKSYERDRKEAMNARIKRLDALATTYHKNEGTHMMFLSQTNRTGMATLADQDNNAAQGATSDQKGAKKTKKVDFTVISEFNALYEKAVVALVCSSSDNAREEKLMAINIVKVRNSERPPEFIKVYADFAYCKVGHRAPVLVENSVSLEEKFVKYKKACEVLNYVPKTTVEDDFNNDDE